MVLVEVLKAVNRPVYAVQTVGTPLSQYIGYVVEPYVSAVPIYNAFHRELVVPNCQVLVVP